MFSFVLIGISKTVLCGKYFFKNENFTQQNFTYNWRVYISTGYPEQNFGLQNEPVVLFGEKLLNATW